MFLDALIKSRPDSRLKRVIAFEPALGPFGRLLDNLKVNETHFVLPFRAAIANTRPFVHSSSPRTI